MKKVTSFKGIDQSFQKDLVHFDSSTNFTDSDEGHNMNQLYTGIPLDLTSCTNKLEEGRLFQRTSSLSLFKQNSTKIMFEFFGRSLFLDSSDKTQTQVTLNNWITQSKISQLNKIQVKMIVFQELSKKNPQFNDLLDSIIQDYANAKMKTIQQNEISSNQNQECT